MPSAEVSVFIERSPEEVFNFLADHRNDRRWRSEVRDIQRLFTESVGMGDIYREVIVAGRGWQFEGQVEVTDAVPGRRLVGKGDFQGVVLSTTTYTLEPVDSGTTLNAILELELRPPLNLMAMLVNRDLRKRGEDNLGRLKQILEGAETPLAAHNEGGSSA